MNPLFEAGIEFQEFLDSKDWGFCVIGGVAVIRWGEIRTTQDIDLSIFVGYWNEEIYVDALLSRFESRIDDARNFALSNRVLLLFASNGVEVDISLAGIPFEKKMIENATPFEYLSNCSLITCSAEDLIVLKAFADRTIDWADIEGIIMRQGNALNTEYIIAHLKPLCEIEGKQDTLDRLKSLLNRFGNRTTGL